MLQTLPAGGVRVPDGFVLTAEAFRLHLAQGGLAEWVERTLAGGDVRDVKAVAEAGQAIRTRIRETPLPAELLPPVQRAYEALSRRYDEGATDVAVRSSATAEDLPGAVAVEMSGAESGWSRAPGMASRACSRGSRTSTRIAPASTSFLASAGGVERCGFRREGRLDAYRGGGGEPPLLTITRVATRDTELGGVPIPEGSTVMPMLGSANRQEDRHP